MLLLLPTQLFCTPGIRYSKSVARRWSGVPVPPCDICSGRLEYITFSMAPPRIASVVVRLGGAVVTVTVSAAAPTVNLMLSEIVSRALTVTFSCTIFLESGRRHGDGVSSRRQRSYVVVAGAGVYSAPWSGWLQLRPR